MTNDVDLYEVWQNLLVDAGSRDPNEDLTGDGNVDMADVQVVMDNYLADLPLPAPPPAQSRAAANEPVSAPPVRAETSVPVAGADDPAVPAPLPATRLPWSAAWSTRRGELHPWHRWLKPSAFEFESEEEEGAMPFRPHADRRGLRPPARTTLRAMILCMR